jgi:hypothetical protein
VDSGIIILDDEGGHVTLVCLGVSVARGGAGFGIGVVPDTSVAFADASRKRKRLIRITWLPSQILTLTTFTSTPPSWMLMGSTLSL